MDRTGVINTVISYVGARSYLEIGIGNGINFSRVKCEDKESVDPGGPECTAEPTHKTTSDRFFFFNKRLYDVVFIDGCHQAEHVYSDLKNALALDPMAVLCHDLSPSNEKMQRVPRETPTWTGDSWRAWLRIRNERPFDDVFVVDCNYGVGVIIPGHITTPGSLVAKWATVGYGEFDRNRGRWLPLISVEKFKELYGA